MSAEPGAEPAAAPSETEVQAGVFKDEANKLFSDKKFNAAIELYTKAIELAPTAALFSNRAFAHIKNESMGSALLDADAAIACDKLFVKAYHRKGTALASLGKLKLAKREFEKVLKLQPKNKDAQKKVKQLDKALKAIAFAAAISIDETSVADEVSDEMASMDVEPGYDGPHMKDPLTRECIEGMMEAFQNQKKLHRKYMFQILLKVKEVLQSYKSLVDVAIPECDKFTVCGDVHGQYYDLVLPPPPSTILSFCNELYNCFSWQQL